jgi:hypothetical protein
VYDHDQGELADLGWEEFIRRQWDAVYTAYRTGRGRRTLCRGWADLLEAGLDCSQELADLLVRAEILDRADRDLEGTTNPRALVAGMSRVITDVRTDLLELGPEELRLLEPCSREEGPALPGLLDRHAALRDFLGDYAAVEDTAVDDAG